MNNRISQQEKLDKKNIIPDKPLVSIITPRWLGADDTYEPDACFVFGEYGYIDEKKRKTEKYQDSFSRSCKARNGEEKNENIFCHD